MKKILLTIFLIYSILLGKDYKGAEYRTYATFTYGRFEVCYKSSPGPGQTSTFFTYHELGALGSNEWNEIDIEILGRYRNDVQFNPITPGQVNHVYHRYVDFDPSEDYHTYAFEWTPDYVAWFVDGVETHRQTGEHIEALDQGQKIMMNIWPPTYSGWVGTLDPASLPKFAYYDFVSYSSYTPGSGNRGTDNNFTFEWQDDFNSWDNGRWGKATHTFSGNNCDFIPENIVFHDGKMILCLTDATNTGYTDKNPPVPQYAWYNGNDITIRFTEELNKESAEKMGNYVLRNGGVVNSITLAESNREVKLDVTGYDMSVAHDILVFNVDDKFETVNTSTPKFLNIINPPAHTYPVKINVGGDATGDYLEDQEWDFDKNYGHVTGTEGSTYVPIANTTDDIVYQTELRDFVMYHVRVPNGVYKVTLMFSENYFKTDGGRVFDINIEGNYAAKGLDVYKEASANTAYNLVTDNVEVTDGMIDIHFGATKDFAFLHGIQIDQISQTSVDNDANLLNYFQLQPNYPNPFNGSTTIKFQLEKDANVDLSIFDIQGHKIETLVNGFQKIGEHNINWIPKVASGVYFVQMKVGNQALSQKMLYLK